MSRKTTATDPRLPAPGQIVSREYKGKPIVVTVRPNGFEYDSRIHRVVAVLREAARLDAIEALRYE